MLTEDYWQNRYEAAQTGWDTGGITPPLQEYFDGLSDKTPTHSYPWLWQWARSNLPCTRQGFQNVYVCDWAAAPLAALAKRCPDFPTKHLFQGDFFQLELSELDYIVEQTFFCAIDPALRPDYAQKSSIYAKKGWSSHWPALQQKLTTRTAWPSFWRRPRRIQRLL